MAGLATNSATDIMEDILDMVSEDVQSQVAENLLPSEDNTEDVENEDISYQSYNQNQDLNSSLSAVDGIEIDSNNMEKDEADTVTIEDIGDKEITTGETADKNCCHSWFDLFKDAFGSWGRLRLSLNKPLSTIDDETLNKPAKFGPDDFTLEIESEAKLLDDKSGLKDIYLNEEVCDDELEYIEALGGLEDIYETAVMNEEFDMDNTFIEGNDKSTEVINNDTEDDDENDPPIKTAKTPRNESSIGMIDSLAKKENIPRRRSKRLEMKRKRKDQQSQDEGEKEEIKKT